MWRIIRSIRFKRIVMAALVALSGLGLACCGGESEGNSGSSGDTAQASDAQGAYQGNASNGLFFFTLVLDDNKYYILYGSAGSISSGTFEISGFMTGDGVTDKNAFLSRNLRDSFFNGDTSRIGSLNATFNSGQWFSGSIGQNNSTAVTFLGTKPNPAIYDYERHAGIDRIKGAWDIQGSTLLINDKGEFTATLSGCSIAGTATPRNSGKNVYDISFTFGASPCGFPLRKASGIALELTPNSGVNQQLIMLYAVENTNNSQLGFFSSSMRINVAR